MNKILSFILIFIGAVLLIGCGDSDFGFEVNDNRVTITSYLGTNPHVRIPNRINGLPVVEIGCFAFAYLSNPVNAVLGHFVGYSRVIIESVRFNQNLERIGLAAFEESKISTITLSENIIYISARAFRNNFYLEEIIFNNRLKEIGSGAFANTALRELDFPNSLIWIETAFAYNQNLTKIHLNEGLVGLPMAFIGTNIESVNIPSTVRNITRSFYGVSSLKNVTFNEGLERIIGPAFQGTSLKSIILPSSLRVLAFNSFANIPTLSEVILNEGLEFIGDNVFKNTSITTINIPTTVRNIGNNAFSNNLMLTDVIFNEGLVTIGNNAFENSPITSLNLPSTLVTIGEGAFQGTNLLYVIMPANLRTIGQNAFRNIDTLERVYLNFRLEYIGFSAFRFTNLTSVVIPISVVALSLLAFDENVLLIYHSVSEGTGG